jgi:Phosphotransferase enzyme family
MNSTPQLPYYADRSSLPAPLPTEAEIKGSQVILSEYGGRKTVRVGRYFVVKYGQILEEIEAHNMMFVRGKTKIPVPKVYAIFRSQDKEVLYIIMECIEGSTLLAKWPAMSDSDKDLVVKKLKHYFDELRRIPSPSYYGSLGRRHMLDSMFWTGEGANRNPAINGPFKTESGLNEALVQKMMLIASANGRHSSKADFYRRSLPSIFSGHKPIFTHGDFQRKNIIVRKIFSTSTHPNTVSKTNKHKEFLDEYEITLIDWEKAGWYPTYWEYCAATFSFRWDDDWPSRVDNILRPYRTEFPWLHMLFNELWS